MYNLFCISEREPKCLFDVCVLQLHWYFLGPGGGGGGSVFGELYTETLLFPKPCGQANLTIIFLLEANLW